MMQELKDYYCEECHQKLIAGYSAELSYWCENESCSRHNIVVMPYFVWDDIWKIEQSNPTNTQPKEEEHA